MKLKQFVGMCAERDKEVVVRNSYGAIVAKGTVRDVVFDNKFTWCLIKDKHLILEAYVYCFHFSGEKLNITLK